MNDDTMAGLRVIAIDGPAGSGKSTIGRRVAAHLGLEYLDTGAMYRSVAFLAIQQGVDPEDADAVAGLARAMELVVSDGNVRVNGIDASVEIRGPEVTRAVSVVAANPEVRTEMRARQRLWALERGGGVIEGRDIGSVVFPDAIVKVFLTASPEERARRRAQEMTDLEFDQVASDLARRDARDENRADSPLHAAPDADVVDTTGLTIEEVVERISTMVDERS